jgi:hypothetical protein
MNFDHTLPKAKLLDSRNQALLRLCQGKTILHLGFVDDGFFDDQLKRRNWLHAQISQVAGRLVGLDICEEGVRRARELGYADCFAGDVEELSHQRFPRLSYDIILAADILEHLANPGLFLSELAMVADENTTVVFTTPNALSIKTLFFPLARTEAVHPDHNFYYSPTTLTTLLRKYGFRVTDIGLYSTIWVPNGQKSHGLGELIAKSIFTGFDAILRYSVVPLFPYYSEGMLVRAKKEIREVCSVAHA